MTQPEKLDDLVANPDAIDYARLDRERGFFDPPGAVAPRPSVLPPTEAEHALMRTFAISFQDGVYRWREHHYDRLADALAYASLDSPLAS